jgi:deoxyribodipyrimidine photolyase
VGDRPVIVWFRRDLRVHDHPALSEAVRTGAPVVPLFVFDPRLVDGRFASPNRLWFLLGSVAALRGELERRGDAATPTDRLHGEPCPDDRRELPDEGSADRLASRRSALHAPPDRWRSSIEPGGWQWAASVGTDAQPYFRIFNPVTQGRRFDPDGDHIREWAPELAAVPTARIHEPWTMSAEEQTATGCRIGVDYPAPIVDHAVARRRALAAFEDAGRRG